MDDTGEGVRVVSGGKTDEQDGASIFRPIANIWLKYRDDPGKYNSTLSSVLVLAGLGIWCIFAVFAQNVDPVKDKRFYARPATFPENCKLPPKRPPLNVSAATGQNSAMDILIATNGVKQKRASIPLAVKGGRLCPGAILATAESNLVSPTGEHGQLAPNQVVSWGEVDQYGTHVRIFVWVSPRLGVVSGAGGYSGTVSLNDRRAQGGNVQVGVHVLYPFLAIVLPFAFLAAFGGFTWAWLVHYLGKSPAPSRAQEQRFWRNFFLRIAVLLVAAVPALDAQVLTNRDWQGTLTQYIELAVLAGGTAIAVTPTFRALVFAPAGRSEEG